MLETCVPPPIVATLAAIAMAAASYLPPSIEPETWHKGAAATLVAAGVGLLFLGLRGLRAAHTTFDPTKPDRASRLVVSGIYRFTRNPMYLGFAVLLVAEALWLASPWAVGGPLLFVSFIDRFQIRPEERALRSKFGGEYEAYERNVRRWP